MFSAATNACMMYSISIQGAHLSYLSGKLQTNQLKPLWVVQQFLQHFFRASWHEYFYTSSLLWSIRQYLETFGVATTEGIILVPHGQGAVMLLNNTQDNFMTELFTPKCSQYWGWEYTCACVYTYICMCVCVYVCIIYMYVCVGAKLLQLCLTFCDLSSIAHQAPLPMGFSRNTGDSPLPWDSPLPRDSPLPMGFSKNTGVGCHALLQRIFLTQWLNLVLLYLLQWQEGSLPLAPLGKLHK